MLATPAFSKKIYFILKHVCVYVCAHKFSRGWKKESDSLELELQEDVSHLTLTGNRTPVLWKSSQHSHHWTSSPSAWGCEGHIQDTAAGDFSSLSLTLPVLLGSFQGMSSTRWRLNDKGVGNAWAKLELPDSSAGTCLCYQPWPFQSSVPKPDPYEASLHLLDLNWQPPIWSPHLLP